MNILEIAEIIGIISFALSGFLIAVEVKLDILGIFIASFLTALGGGVIRDVIVGRELFAFSNNYASVLVIAVIMIAIFLKAQRMEEDIEKHPLFMVADTFGMVSFAISGAMVAQEAEFNFFGVILLSLITAVGGGVMRDILINKIPLILVSEFYGTVALFVGILIFILGVLSWLNIWSIIIVFWVGVLLRFVAVSKEWNLPKI